MKASFTAQGFTKDICHLRASTCTQFDFSAPSPGNLNHHAGQCKSCAIIVMSRWMLSYPWRCGFSRNDPTKLNCLQQGALRWKVSPYPLGVLGSHLSPQRFREATFSSQSLLYESKKTDPARLHLKLQVISCCRLVEGRSPGFSQLLVEGTLQTRYRISTLRCVFEFCKRNTGWGSDKKNKSFESQQPLAR